MSAERAVAVRDAVATPAELLRASKAGLDALLALTLVFSAKEAIFKCLHPAVGRIFGFADVQILAVDCASRMFRACVVNALAASFPAGTELAGGFDIDAHHVHTGMILPAAATASTRR